MLRVWYQSSRNHCVALSKVLGTFTNGTPFKKSELEKVGFASLKWKTSIPIYSFRTKSWSATLLISIATTRVFTGIYASILSLFRQLVGQKHQ